MKIYIAGHPRVWEKDGFYDFYRLESFVYGKGIKLNSDRYKDFILDSGAFTFMTAKGGKHEKDWDSFADAYADFVKENSVKNYIELDIDKIVGIEKVLELRKRIEKRVGWQCMPVWHVGRGYDAWMDICREYKYVCFGAFLTDGIPESKYKFIPRFLSDAKSHGCMVHGLGFTSNSYLRKLKFDSVDSSSWTAGGRFRGYHTFERGEIKLTRVDNTHRVKDAMGLHTRNFYEWIKFSRYAEEML